MYRRRWYCISHGSVPYKLCLNSRSVSVLFSCQLFLTDFYFTACLANFITHERAYCLYPLETLEKYIALPTVDYTFFCDDIIQKYTARGFSFFPFACASQFRHKGVRWVEDSHAFVVPLFPGRTYYPYSNLVDPIRLTSWSITTSPDDRPSINYWVMPCSQDDDADLLTVSSKKMMDVLFACASAGSPERNEFSGFFPGDGSQS